MTSSQIQENILRVRYSIEEAAKASGRTADSVKLCAVSKFHPAEDVLSAIGAGQFLFGENRVQEASEKFERIYSDVSVKTKPELNIIGSLQTNKVKKAVEYASCIQSVDRISLIGEIEKQCTKLDKNMNVLLEIHTGEESKSGYSDMNVLFSDLQSLAEEKFPHVHLKGLMTMAPFTENETLVRKSFSSLRLIQEKIRSEYPQLNVDELSMGMSGDYKIAISEGSTMVRIGTAIFGERNYNA